MVHQGSKGWFDTERNWCRIGGHGNPNCVGDRRKSRYWKGEGLEGPAPYSVFKAALNALTIKLASEVRGNVKVNAVCPGWVRTRMGGPGAELSVEQGADTVVWLATLPPNGPNGGIFRNRERIPW